MTGKLDKFYVECGIHGAKIMTTSSALTPNCVPGEIETYVDLLKADLDACAEEMKRKWEAQQKTLPFDEGLH